MGAKVIRTIQRHQACLPTMLQHQLQPHQQHQSNNLGTGQITASGGQRPPQRPVLEGQRLVQ